MLLQMRLPPQPEVKRRGQYPEFGWRNRPSGSFTERTLTLWPVDVNASRMMVIHFAYWLTLSRSITNGTFGIDLKIKKRFP